jgi:hypothetical protein
MSSGEMYASQFLERSSLISTRMALSLITRGLVEEDSKIIFICNFI